MIKISEILELARRTAMKSPIRVKVSAILVDKRTGKVVATGFNNRGQHRRNGRYSVHAEVDALRKVRKPSSNLIMILYREGGKIITPCDACAQAIEAYGICKVYYTSRRT